MKENNTNLPQNIQSLITGLNPGQSVPLAVLNDIPFIVYRVSDETFETLQKNDITCSIKPSIINVTTPTDVIALSFVHFRLNDDEAHTFYTVYDLNQSKQSLDCHAMLTMEKHGVLLLGDTVHDFLSFESTFTANFHPLDVLKFAKDKASDYAIEKFEEVKYALIANVRTSLDLYTFFEQIAPFDKSWYAHLDMGKEKIEA